VAYLQEQEGLQLEATFHPPARKQALFARPVHVLVKPHPAPPHSLTQARPVSPGKLPKAGASDEDGPTAGSNKQQTTGEVAPLEQTALGEPPELEQGPAHSKARKEKKRKKEGSLEAELELEQPRHSKARKEKKRNKDRPLPAVEEAEPEAAATADGSGGADDRQPRHRRRRRRRSHREQGRNEGWEGAQSKAAD
jgi:hypothetical protein